MPRNSRPSTLRTTNRRRVSTHAPRRRVQGNENQFPFVPPEDWHEPHEEASTEYSVIHQAPGRGFWHPLSPSDVRQRLAELPEHMILDLQVVQLSRMTRKKRTFPCYGMQWGPAIYLYPVDDTLEEIFSRPPNPRELVETKMFGGKWTEDSKVWRLRWTEKTIRDFYLNNVLIHELGHLLDSRNRSYTDRERYAEWFAIEHGYRATRNSKRKKVKRRHHS